MRILQRPEALSPGSALCIGAFDGLHRGHRCLLQRARDQSSELAILTFEPHPAAILAPERAPPRIASAKQRARIARALGVNTLAELPFDKSVAALEPEAFCEIYLLKGLKPTRVIVGQDFRFGRGAQGDTDLLRATLRSGGIEVDVVDQLDDASGEKVGSSAIRGLLAAGKVARAAALLGYAHAAAGLVRHGAKRGRQLGFRTANIESNCLVPRPGVYAGWLTVHPERGGEASDASELPPSLPAVANVGSNPTFADAAEITTGVEVHAIDADLGESLYDRQVEFAFFERLRDEARFASVEKLRDAIEQDVQQARERLSQQTTDIRRPRPVVAGEGAAGQ